MTTRTTVFLYDLEISRTADELVIRGRRMAIALLLIGVLVLVPFSLAITYKNIVGVDGRAAIWNRPVGERIAVPLVLLVMILPFALIPIWLCVRYVRRRRRPPVFDRRSGRLSRRGQSWPLAGLTDIAVDVRRGKYRLESAAVVLRCGEVDAIEIARFHAGSKGPNLESRIVLARALASAVGDFLQLPVREPPRSGEVNGGRHVSPRWPVFGCCGSQVFETPCGENDPRRRVDPADPFTSNGGMFIKVGRSPAGLSSPRFHVAKSRWVFAAAVVGLALLLHARAGAEEGMWTFDNPPTKQLKEKYHFEPTPAWLNHLRLSSVRLGDGGSGSFVSGHGLLLTNHHVALHQLQNASTAEHNYIRDGFYAADGAAEIASPDLEVNVLDAMQNVTARVNAAVKADMPEAAAFKTRRAEIAAIEKESTDQTHLKSDVVTLYGGGEYWLYRYKKYTDVRLVFAPELQTAFYGGDFDNFTFPRYCLDMAVFRVYENGKPLETPNHLAWNIHGAEADELVFVSGHPGHTERAATMAELKTERDFRDPLQLDSLTDVLATLHAYAKRGPDQARDVASHIYGLENALKGSNARYQGLRDADLMAKKQLEEDEFRSRIDGDPRNKTEAADAFKEIEEALAAVVVHGKAPTYRQPRTVLYHFASFIVTYVEEVKKPDAERLPGFHEAESESLQFRFLAPTPLHPQLELALMTSALEFAKKKLPADDPWLVAMLDGKTPAEAADQWISKSKMSDADFRKQLLTGGAAAVDACTDPLIVLARTLNPLERSEQKWSETHNQSQLDHAHRQLAKAKFDLYGKNSYPDATFTLRLSYGTTTGYPMNGTQAPWKTTLLGLYARTSEFDGAAPWNLTPRWKEGRERLTLTTPFNFVCTCDIIGGNSGSPIVNRAGELVGLVFDGNIESLPGAFEYDGKINRTVAVHSAAMIEALRKIYGAGKLADELTAK